MENAMTGEERRKKIIKLMKQSSVSLSGEELGKATGVSRQVIVQDIALLRTEGQPIVATARGYILNIPKHAVRLFKVRHTNDEIEDELTTIVDLGGCVEDVIINHRAYGKISAPLKIKNRRDVSVFINQLKTGKSSALLNVTSGYHYHHISAESEYILEEIEAALKEKQYLAELLPYEEAFTER